MTRRSTKLFKAALVGAPLHRAPMGLLRRLPPATASFSCCITSCRRRRATSSRIGILKITPEFLESVIVQVREAGFDFIWPGRCARAAQVPRRSRPFAVFTLDDGYKDNRDFAYPVFKRHGVPFTIYVASDFADGSGDLVVAEHSTKPCAGLNTVTLDMNGARKRFRCARRSKKMRRSKRFTGGCGPCRRMRARAITHRLAREAGFDPRAFCRDLVMDWDELRALAADPLVTIAAHTCGHYALAKLPEDAMRDEMRRICAARIEAELGRPCRHFSYPIWLRAKCWRARVCNGQRAWVCRRL